MASSIFLRRSTTAISSSSSTLLSKFLNPIRSSSSTTIAPTTINTFITNNNDDKNPNLDRRFNHSLIRRNFISSSSPFDPLSQIRNSPQFANPNPSIIAAARLMGCGTNPKMFSTEAVGAPKVQSFRPLSPHLTIYNPQINSTFSIINRIAVGGLSGLVVFYYLVFVKMGPICFTYKSFFDVMYYTTKLAPITLELSALAVLYITVHSVRDLLYGKRVLPKFG